MPNQSLPLLTLLIRFCSLTGPRDALFTSRQASTDDHERISFPFLSSKLIRLPLSPAIASFFFYPAPFASRWRLITGRTRWCQGKTALLPLPFLPPSPLRPRPPRSGVNPNTFSRYGMRGVPRGFFVGGGFAIWPLCLGFPVVTTFFFARKPSGASSERTRRDSTLWLNFPPRQRPFLIARARVCPPQRTAPSYPLPTAVKTISLTFPFRTTPPSE